MKLKHSLLAVVVSVLAMAAPAWAQPGPGGQPDFAAMRQRFSDMMKEQLGATDDEWKILQPKIEAIQTMANDAANRGGMMRAMFGGNFRPPNFGGTDTAPSAVDQKSTDLQSALDDQNAKPDDLKAKMTALRAARDQARANLAKAQAELRELLTARQEAALVLMGVLE